MKENEVVDIIKKELCVDSIEMDKEGQWDSLDLVTVLIALDTAFDDKLKDVRELQTVKTPRDVINVLRSKGFVE